MACDETLLGRARARGETEWFRQQLDNLFGPEGVYTIIALLQRDLLLAQNEVARLEIIKQIQSQMAAAGNAAIHAIDQGRKPPRLK